MLTLVLFASLALFILTGPGPAAIVGYFAGKGPGFGTQLGQRDLRFSLLADGLAWLTCLVACFFVGRLTYRLRDQVPFSSTIYVLGLVLMYFGLLRMVGYATLWSPLARLSPVLLTIRASAAVVVTMGLAVLFPYIQAMVRMAMTANKDHEKFVVAAESSLDAFYIMESVRDAANNIADFRFSYVNANGEQRLGRPREELIGVHMGDLLPYVRTTDVLERFKQVVETGVPFTVRAPGAAGRHRSLLDRDAGSEAG